MPQKNADARKEYNRIQYLKKKGAVKTTEPVQTDIVCLLKFHTNIKKVNAEFLSVKLKPGIKHNVGVCLLKCDKWKNMYNAVVCELGQLEYKPRVDGLYRFSGFVSCAYDIREYNRLLKLLNPMRWNNTPKTAEEKKEDKDEYYDWFLWNEDKWGDADGDYKKMMDMLYVVKSCPDKVYNVKRQLKSSRNLVNHYPYYRIQLNTMKKIHSGNATIKGDKKDLVKKTFNETYKINELKEICINNGMIKTKGLKYKYTEYVNWIYTAMYPNFPM